MPDFLLPHVCQEVQNFTSSCEHLLFAAHTSSFNADELALLVYYTAEVTTMIDDKVRIRMNTHPGDIAWHECDETV